MRSNHLVRVAVMSPQPVVKAGLVSLLSRHPDRVEIVPAPPTGPEAAADADDEPDVVLYDAIGLLASETPDLDYVIDHTAAQVLAVSRDLRTDLAGRVLRRGAQGYFSLGVSDEELLAAVESAVTGWVAGDPGADPTVGSGTSAAQTLRTGNDVDLSEREVQMLTFIAQGLSNQEIAKQTYLSINSVKTYIRSAYHKVGVQTRSQAVSWAIQNGIDPG